MIYYDLLRYIYIYIYIYIHIHIYLSLSLYIYIYSERYNIQKISLVFHGPIAGDLPAPLGSRKFPQHCARAAPASDAGEPVELDVLGQVDADLRPGRRKPWEMVEKHGKTRFWRVLLG